MVAEARDGKEVLEVLDEFQPDILLLDLKMPGLDGLTALRSFRTLVLKLKSSYSQHPRTRTSLFKR